MPIAITPTRALSQNGRPVRLLSKPYARRIPDIAELDPLVAVETQNATLWVFVRAEGCGDECAISMSWQSITQPTKSPVAAARNTMNAQMRIPVFSDGAGVIEGITARYGYRNQIGGSASVKYFQVFSTPRFWMMRG